MLSQGLLKKYLGKTQKFPFSLWQVGRIRTTPDLRRSSSMAGKETSSMAVSSNGLGNWPLTSVMWVRVPLSSPVPQRRGVVKKMPTTRRGWDDAPFH